MANISTNPIRWQIDTLSARLTGVVASSASNNFDLIRASNITHITVSGSQPSGTARYFAFRINGIWGKLTTSGTFQAFSSNNADFSTLEASGNTAAQLEALTDVPALSGRAFGVAIALSANDYTNAVPTAGLSFSCKNDTQQLKASQTSPLYQLGSNSQLISLDSESVCSNGGAVTVLAQATLPNGTLSAWQSLDALKGTKCSAVRFRADYSSTEVGTSSAKLSQAYLVYADGNAIVSGLTDGAIITQSVDWYIPVHSCRLTVRHAPLQESTITAFVAFREQPLHVSRETLGVGSGGRKTFQLAHKDGIKYDSLRLYYDNIQTFTNYELNAAAGRVTCEAPEGVLVSCDYDYGWDLEDWHQMTPSGTLSLEEYDTSEFRYLESQNNKSVAAIKIVLGTKSGRINNEVLGTGTGAAKSFRLSHMIYDGRISLTANNAALSNRQWSLLEDPQYVSVAASAGAVIRASYDWLSETPAVYQFAAVFSQ